MTPGERKAVALLKNKGYGVTSPSEPNILWLVKIPHGDSFRYSSRHMKINSRGTKWPDGTVIARVPLDRLIWEPIENVPNTKGE